METTVDEKIRLLKEIKPDPEQFGKCYSCRGRFNAAKKLIDQMVGYEIAKLKGEVE
jgi:pentatricopeptide repeat protein